jgi:protein phosphatase-4 regulatory subunit 3
MLSVSRMSKGVQTFGSTYSTFSELSMVKEIAVSLKSFVQTPHVHILASDENEDPLTSSPPSGRVTFNSIVHASQLPPPQFGIMLEVERAINHVGRNPNLRDRLCEHIISTVRPNHSFGLFVLNLPIQDYIRLMIDLASQSEDLEQLEDLHALCSCMQTIREWQLHSQASYSYNSSSPP